jgi:hypothetical protein
LTTAENEPSQGQSSVQSRAAVLHGALLGVAIAAPALSYLVYVSHYALNVPFGQSRGMHLVRQARDSGCRSLTRSTL